MTPSGMSVTLASLLLAPALLAQAPATLPPLQRPGQRSSSESSSPSRLAPTTSAPAAPAQTRAQAQTQASPGAPASTSTLASHGDPFQPPPGATNAAPISEGPAPQPAPSSDTDPDNPDDPDDPGDDAKEGKRSQRFGGLKFFRLAISPKFGWTDGVSEKNGLFDLQATIDASIQNGQGTIAGGGTLGAARFGGLAYGFDLDLEIVFINIWADLDKFINPGGMWSVRLGYDHDFRPHERVNINLGVGAGFMRIFLGDALEQLDFDPNDPTKTDIARAGVVTRANLNLDIWLAGPLYTGPQFMVGYHYLFSANDESVISEQGMHYSAAWNLKLRFALPTENPRR